MKSRSARVVKLVDTADLKSAAYPRGGVPVRFRSRAPALALWQAIPLLFRKLRTLRKNHLAGVFDLPRRGAAMIRLHCRRHTSKRTLARSVHSGRARWPFPSSASVFDLRCILAVCESRFVSCHGPVRAWLLKCPERRTECHAENLAQDHLSRTLEPIAGLVSAMAIASSGSAASISSHHRFALLSRPPWRRSAFSLADPLLSGPWFFFRSCAGISCIILLTVAGALLRCTCRMPF